ncbi:cytochrome c oxidase assembly protein [Thiohalophilus sp.]|uniref:cytochrome c oxidase assembly protein n=1 Tax=Thiohalophilus sp. TaxID=3028392 RepID=UPI002ACF01CA|nr:cytochrome c oxidase assembly protein [Thiohalophilus sp.]MDZ7803282.1 cytochrome c oxidase assembly protein [Thiohalophilus sp.]
MPSLVTLIKPWEFSPTVLVSTLAAAVLYWRGIKQRRRDKLRTGFWPTLSFCLGLLLIYGVMQTYVDYLSQHMFWVHRLQHLVLHHLGPFLIVLATPHKVLGRGIPQKWRQQMLLPIWYSRPVRGIYRFLQNPVVAPALFVGLIYLWLIPEVHFEAMLSATRYKIMNWSMLIDGLLFWWLIVDPRPPRGRITLHYSSRIVMLWVVMVLQIIIGAYIALSGKVLYDVYSVCGRAWPISPLTDQTIGGLTTWIPAAMMSVVGILLIIRLWMRQSAQAEQKNVSGGESKQV